MSNWPWVALERVGDAVIVLDGQGCVTFMNPAAGRLAGVSPEEGTGRRLEDVLWLFDEETGRPTSVLSEAGGGPLHARLMRPGGAGCQVEATVSPVANGHGTGTLLLILRDVSEHIRTAQALQESGERLHDLEEELRRRTEELAAEDRRKDQFLAMLAHELRNPLAPIRNAVELMRQVETVDPSFHPSREMVERQVKHLARLVDDLLDVSRIARGNIRLRNEPVDFSAVVQRAVDGLRPLIENRSHALTVRLPAEPLRLEADPARLEQVVSNLLDNAARYTMPGGRVWVTLELEGAEAVLRVRDTGIGVPPDVLDRVFEPFVQSDGSLARTEGGLGVGLTLARSLVEMHGGRVEAHSPGLGQGSEFLVRLPVHPPAEVSTPAPAAEPAANLSQRRSLRVLVVEDNLDAAESLATLLRIWNYEVHVVHDGRSALEAAQVQHPQVVLLDIGLPGLDGYQVARKLREEMGLDALLVAMTGYGQPEDLRRSKEAGIQYHFVKPVEPAVLRELLASVSTSATSPQPLS